MIARGSDDLPSAAAPPPLRYAQEAAEQQRLLHHLLSSRATYEGSGVFVAKKTPDPFSPQRHGGLLAVFTDASHAVPLTARIAVTTDTGEPSIDKPFALRPRNSGLRWRHVALTSGEERDKVKAYDF